MSHEQIDHKDERPFAHDVNETQIMEELWQRSLSEQLPLKTKWISTWKWNTTTSTSPSWKYKNTATTTKNNYEGRGRGRGRRRGVGRWRGRGSGCVTRVVRGRGRGMSIRIIVSSGRIEKRVDIYTHLQITWIGFITWSVKIFNSYHCLKE